MYKNGVNYVFRWNDWNREHIADHGIDVIEAEFVVDHARPPWPQKIGGGKWRVWGPTEQGRLLQVIYVFDPADAIFVVHARDLTAREKRGFRRRRR